MFGYSWLREGQYQVLIDDILDTCSDYDIEIEGIHTETGPGVWEAALKYDDVVAAADKAALLKTTLKQICARHDLSRSRSWRSGTPTSRARAGIFTRASGTSARRSICSRLQGSDNLSETGLHYLGGLLALAPELTALYSPFINSYKRYVPGVWGAFERGHGASRTALVPRV